MKHFKNNQEEFALILTKDEVRIIGDALTNRMVRLNKMEKEQPNSTWIQKEWMKCLDLQCEWFNIN